MYVGMCFLFFFALIVNCSREFVQLKRNAKSEMWAKHSILFETLPHSNEIHLIVCFCFI